MLDLDNADLTIAMWVQLRNAPAGDGLIISFVDGANAVFQIGADGASGTFTARMEDTSSYGTRTGGVDLNIGSDWQHLAVSRNVADSRMSMYMNGQLVAVHIITGVDANAPTAGWTATINGDGSANNNFPGLIADVRIYDTVLSGDQIFQVAARMGC